MWLEPACPSCGCAVCARGLRAPRPQCAHSTSCYFAVLAARFVYDSKCLSLDDENRFTYVFYTLTRRFSYDTVRMRLSHISGFSAPVSRIGDGTHRAMVYIKLQRSESRAVQAL